MVHVYTIGRQGQQQGGFDFAAMDAKTVLFSAELGIHILALLIHQRQVEPVHAVDQHAQTGPQVARDHIQQAHLSAMGIEQHQLLHAAGGHAFGDLGPQAQHRVCLEGERAAKPRVFR